MLKPIYEEETTTKILYVWQCACRRTDLSWYLVMVLDKNLIPISSQVIKINKYTTLTDKAAISWAKDLLYGQN